MLRTFAALGMALGLVSAAAAAPPTVIVNLDNGVPFISSRPLTGFQTTGALMTGMRVTVDYVDGGMAQANWATTGSAAGAAVGPDWRVDESGDTFSSAWTFANTGTRAIRRITFNALPGDTVFDTTFGGAEGTPGSALGTTFFLQSAPDDLNIIATYRNAVGINGQAPVGDIFSHLIIDFTNAGGLPAASRLVYFADSDNLRFGGENPNTCCWENGMPVLSLSQASHEGGGLPFGMKVADDFYLEPGTVNELQSITATVLTNTVVGLTKARAEVYADCDGRPGQLLYTFTEFTKTEGPNLSTLPGYRQVEFQFRPADQNDPALRSIFLKGGSYWLSIVGISPNLCDQQNPALCDITYWATADGPMKGSVPVKVEGLPRDHSAPYNYTGQPWRSIADCCIGCRNMSFTVCTQMCKILNDNGDPAIIGGQLGVASQRSLQPQFDARAADDFVSPPCVANSICYVEACVYTNCTPVNGFMDIYANDCHAPGALLATFPATRAVPITLNLPGQPSPLPNGLRAYRLEFHNPGFTLVPGRQYWISFTVADNGAASTQTFWCYASKCTRTCQTLWNRAVGIQQLGQATGQIPPPVNGSSPWVPALGDLSYLIAVHPVDDAPVSGQGGQCAADINRDGARDLLDIFDFLQAWFAGCP
jgi:hypothetical protein